MFNDLNTALEASLVGALVQTRLSGNRSPKLKQTELVSLCDLTFPVELNYERLKEHK